MNENERELDLLVIGANGFVGKRFLEEWYKSPYQLKYKTLFTARSESALANLKNKYSESKFAALDLKDKEKVASLVKKARLVINMAGPFDFLGENVVAPCALYGTHYLDITGEVNFAKRMIEKYHQEAVKSGAVIVPFAGFDSVPSDLGCFLAASLLREMYPEEKCHSVDIIYSMKGGINGGTIASAIDINKKLKLKDFANPYFLTSTPDKKWPRRNRNFLDIRFIDEIKSWVAPFFMEPINSKIIYRTQSLMKDNSLYSQDFSYRESHLIDQGPTLITSVLTSASVLAFAALLSTETGVKVASNFLPKPGQGPTKKTIEAGFFNATVIARTESGKKNN